MSKFKVGDFWRTRGGEKAEIYEIDEDDKIFPVCFSLGVRGKFWVGGDGRLTAGKDSIYDLIEPWKDESTSPIQTRTVKELVPGVYGRVNVLPSTCEGRAAIGLKRGNITDIFHLSAQELRDAAQTFIELAAYLEELEARRDGH